jgi:hypothetical protein
MMRRSSLPGVDYVRSVSVPLPSCEGCGGPLTVTHGQHVVFTTTVTLGDNGYDNVELRDGWCGDCIEEWDERMGTLPPSHG